MLASLGLRELEEVETKTVTVLMDSVVLTMCASGRAGPRKEKYLAG